jgi:hypothetical protein
MFEYAGQDNGTLGVTTSEVASRLGVTEAAIGKRRTPILTGRYSRVMAFEPSWINEGMARATVVIEYYDTNRAVEEGGRDLLAAGRAQWELAQAATRGTEDSRDGREGYSAPVRAREGA